jgi:hypothetical protein
MNPFSGSIEPFFNDGVLIVIIVAMSIGIIKYINNYFEREIKKINTDIKAIKDCFITKEEVSSEFNDRLQIITTEMKNLGQEVHRLEATLDKIIEIKVRHD